jgi:DNA-binding transcriptional LysR family regulator
MLNLVRLQVLAAVAQRGSVTEAARELDYVQSSVSHHLSRLEAEVGLPLIEARGRGIRLTAAGELLAQRALEILGRVRSAQDEMDAMAGLRTGRVRVAGFQSALSTLVADAAAALNASAPGIELILADVHPDIALQQLREGLVDVAVVFRYDDEVPDDVHFRHLFDDPMMLLSRQAEQTLDDHRDSPWIAGCQHCRREFVTACQAAGFTPRIAYTSDDPVVEQALVAAGLGVTTMPALALRTYRADGIEASELTDFRRRVYLATFGDPPYQPATTAFLRALTQAAARL